MTKPSDFIFNSDYLTIAQVSTTKPTTVYFPSSTFPVESQTLKSFHIDREIYSPAVAGAVDRIIIEYNGVKYVADELRKPADPVFSDELYYDQFWNLIVYRKDKNTLVARCVFYPPDRATSIPSTPALTFTISATSFKAPNVL